jgi:glycosyltransferase involved in cell wall biosynthesis
MTETRTKVTVIGTSNWLHVAAHLLERAGLAATTMNRRPEFLLPLWTLSKPCRQAQFIHRLWGGHVWSSVAATKVLGKPLVWHWIGSDVVGYIRHRGVRRKLSRWACSGLVAAHLADSPDLAKELEELGIHAEVCRLLPRAIEAEVQPLPSTFRVMSYWFDDRREFYGGDTILAAARALPDVEFRILGANGNGAPQLPNVAYLGMRRDMDQQFAAVSAFIRMPRHDSLSAMVLEAMARGRYVVYNKPFPTCDQAADVDSLIAALHTIRQRPTPNHIGAEFVRANFSLDREAETLRNLYHRLESNLQRR